MDTGSTSALLAVLSRGDPGELLNALGEQCNLEARDKQGKNLLDVAALFGKPAAVRVLVEKGAPINSSNKSGTLTCEQLRFRHRFLIKFTCPYVSQGTVHFTGALCGVVFLV